MNIQIKIEETEQSIKLYAPYSPSNNKDYKSRGGKWNKDSSAWEFPKTEATVCYRSFAESKKLEIVSVDSSFNPLAAFSDAQLLAEIKRRGL